MKLYPIIYRYTTSTCCSILIFPIDIIQTRILTNQPIIISKYEIELILLSSLIFTIQNYIYNFFNYIDNETIKGILSALYASPIYIFLEYKKIYNRFNLYPKYKYLIFWLTIKKIVLYSILYNIKSSNIQFKYILSSFMANTLSYPIKIIALKTSYPRLNINLKSIKNSAPIEIFKSSLSNFINLFLIYKFKYSPFIY